MGDRVAFASSRGTPIPIANRLYQKSANGAGADEPLLPGNPGELHTPEDWSPDGRHIVFGKAPGKCRGLPAPNPNGDGMAASPFISARTEQLWPSP
jgi:Tol biopolymer transport system component